MLLRDPAPGDVTEMDVRGELPDHVVSPLRCYISGIPGYDPAIPLAQQTRPSAAAAQLRVAVRLLPASTSTTLRHSNGRRPPDAKSGCPVEISFLVAFEGPLP